ncbi:far upstream element-binding protein [Pseudoscourfieldia marina]
MNSAALSSFPPPPHQSLQMQMHVSADPRMSHGLGGGGAGPPPPPALLGAPLIPPGFEQFTQYHAFLKSDAPAIALQLDGHRAGRLIGKGGENIKALMEVSTCEIKVGNRDQDNPAALRAVTVRATNATTYQEAYARLQQGIKAISESAATETIDASRQVRLPEEAANRVCGPSGQGTFAIGARTNTQVHLDRSLGALIIRGPAHACIAASILVDDVVAGRAPTQALPPPPPPGGGGGPPPSLPQPNLGNLVNANVLAAANAMAAATPPTTNFPPPPVGGPPPSTKTQPAEVRMLDAQGMAGRIIGKGGETIKAIQERTGAKVQVLEEGTKVRIAGDPGQVDAATAEVEQVIEESKEYFANKDARRAAAGNGGGGSVVSSFGGGNNFPPPPPLPSSDGPLPEGWEIHKDDEGNGYYFNVLDGRSQWTRPTD